MDSCRPVMVYPSLHIKIATSRTYHERFVTCDVAYRAFAGAFRCGQVTWVIANNTIKGFNGCLDG